MLSIIDKEEKKNPVYLYVTKPEIDYIHKIKISDDISLITKLDLHLASLHMKEYTKLFDNGIINNQIVEMNELQKEHYDKILLVAKQYRWAVFSNKYEKSNKKMCFGCPNGHIRYIVPNSFRIKPGCSACSGRCPLIAETCFIFSIEQLGGKVLGKYNGSHSKVECLCANKHLCCPMPSSIHNGQGMCLKCTNSCPVESKLNFINLVEKLGGKVIGEYINNSTKVVCLCVNKHTCYPYPSNVQKGKGICVKCTNQCPIDAGKRFLTNILTRNGIMIGEYINSKTPVECICFKNHICFPVPNNLNKTGWMCSECSGHSVMAAKRNFVDFVNANGGKVVGEYVHKEKSIECICSNNHICYPTPQRVRDTGIICTTCNKRGGSFGEKLITETLQNMNIHFYKEFHHPSIPSLRFDFAFSLNNKDYYIEYDGRQHFQEISIFHPNPTSFQECRQRDLMKNYIINLDENSVLIRLHYKWGNDKRPLYRNKVINELSEYIKKCFKSNNKIINDDDNLYSWENEKLSNNTINKFYNTFAEIIENFDVDDFYDEYEHNNFIDDDDDDDDNCQNFI